MKGFIDEEAFTRMNYDVVNLDKKKKVIEEWPELHEIESFRKWRVPFLDKIHRYVILMADSKSPLREAYIDLGDRKLEAAMYAGFDGVKNLPKDDVFGGGNKYVLAMIVDYQRYINDQLVTLLDTNEDIFYEFVEASREKILDGDLDQKEKLMAIERKAILSDKLDIIRKRIRDYREELHGDDDDVKEYATVRNTPESRAKNV
jgi:hypothetical protein